MLVQAGTVNFGALIVPNIFVNIIPPAISYLNGVASNIAGYVGAASWGPLNTAVVVSDYPSYQQAFGDLVNRHYDMGTAVATAIMQGALSHKCVRVSDGTDVAAAATIIAGGNISNGGVALAAKYTGTRGNLIKVNVTAGGAANSISVAVGLPGVQPEVFNNIPAPTTAAAWANIVAAINTGAGQLRGPSRLVVASVVGTPTIMPTLTGAALSLVGGTDGASGLTDATVLGVDGTPRTGMYALRNSGCSVATVCDYGTLANMSVIAQFGLAEGIYFIQADVAGSCAAGATGTVPTSSNTVAIDTYAIKMLAGDWIYWQDPVNQMLRVVSPAPFYVGLLANLSPEQSGLNKPLYGISGTQTTMNGGCYSDAELNVIAAARFDLITFPSVGGNYYSARIGINTSSDATIHGDNYSRLTPYIARTFDGALGKWVGKLQTRAQRRAAKAQADAFFQNMWDLDQIGNAQGTMPFKVTLDDTNNSVSQTALGYEFASADVQYLSVIEKFILNLRGGQSVQITSAANQTPSVQLAA